MPTTDAPKYRALREDHLAGLVQYLVTRPYREVAGMLTVLGDLPVVNIQAEPAETQVEPTPPD